MSGMASKPYFNVFVLKTIHPIKVYQTRTIRFSHEQVRYTSTWKRDKFTKKKKKRKLFPRAIQLTAEKYRIMGHLNSPHFYVAQRRLHYCNLDWSKLCNRLQSLEAKNKIEKRIMGDVYFVLCLQEFVSNRNL